MRRRRSFSNSSSISEVVVVLSTTIALMAIVIEGSIQSKSNAPTTGGQQLNDVETGLHPTVANYSKWSDNASSTGPDNGSSASTLTESNTQRGGGLERDSTPTAPLATIAVVGGATMSTPGALQTTTVNKLSHSQRDGTSISGPQSSPYPGNSPTDSDISYSEYGIDVREELRTDGGESAATAGDDAVIDSGLEVSNLINGAAPSSPHEAGHAENDEQDERKGRSNRKSTSLFDLDDTARTTAQVSTQPLNSPAASQVTRLDDEERVGGGSGSSRNIIQKLAAGPETGDGAENSGWSINNKSVFNESHSQGSPSAATEAPSARHTVTTFTPTTRPLITPTAASSLGSSRRGGQTRQYTSKQYHDHHWGPFFEDPHLNRKTPDTAKADSPIQVGIHLGTEAFLNCRVGMLRDKTVMWVRKTTDKVSLLTVGNNTYSGDSRISIRFQYPNNWRLQINPVQADDAGLYMCQVSTHPPRVFATNVTILAPAIRVVDEHGHEVHDRYYKMGSAIDLTCQIATSFLAIQPSIAPPPGTALLNIPKATITSTLVAATTRGPLPVFPQIPKPNAIHTFNSNNAKNSVDEGVVGSAQHNKREHHYDYLHQRLLWQKDNGPLPKDVQVNLSATPEWRNSRISIQAADRTHSGTYSCSLLNTTLTVVNVQVLNALLPGEMPAAVQHNASGRPPVLGQSPMPIILVLLFYRFLLSAHIC